MKAKLNKRSLNWIQLLENIVSSGLSRADLIHLFTEIADAADAYRRKQERQNAAKPSRVNTH